MAEGKGARFLLGIFVAAVVVILGWLIYGAYIGSTGIATVTGFLVIGAASVVLVSLFIKGKTGTWDVEDIIMGAGAVGVVYAYLTIIHPLLFGNTFSIVPSFEPILNSIARSFSLI
jgi:hypothetical protein